MVYNSYTFCIGVPSSAIYSVLEPIAKDTDLTLADLNAGTGYMVRSFFRTSRLMLKAGSSYYSDGVAWSGSLLRYNTESAPPTCYRCLRRWRVFSTIYATHP